MIEFEAPFYYSVFIRTKRRLLEISLMAFCSVIPIVPTQPFIRCLKFSSFDVQCSLLFQEKHKKREGKHCTAQSLDIDI